MLGWRHYHYDPLKAKCKLTGRIAHVVNKYSFLVGSQVLHGVLLLLFIYPLVKHTLMMRRQRKSQSSQSAEEKESLMRVVRRCTLLSILCIVTDVLVIIFSMSVPDSPSKLRHFSYNVNAIINTVAIIASLVDWKRMLCPCGIRERTNL